MSTMIRVGVVAMMVLTAVALGLIGMQLVRGSGRPVAHDAAVKIGYIAAAHPLPAGTLARDEDFMTKTVAAADMPEEAIKDTPEARAGLRGALIRAYIDVGHPITQADVLRPRDRGFIASVLGAGMRAISVGVDPVSGVAGLIWPGDHVDVILTQHRNSETAAKQVLSETILENVRVIAIDQAIVQGAPSGSATAGKLARTVTLEVTPEQAEKVTVAQQLGRLALAIRSAKDQPDPALLAKTTTFGSDVSPALSQLDHPVGQSVQVIEGDKRKEVTFR